MKPPINRELLVARMDALGLSERQVIAKTGCPYAAFRKMRIEGVIEAHIGVGLLGDIASLLGITLSNLLERPEKTAPEETACVSSSEDAVALIPILVRVGRYVSIAHIARALGWPYARALNALDTVPTCLANTGYQLLRSGSDAAIQPSSRNRDTASAVDRLRTQRSGLQANQAALLRRILNGETADKRSTSTAKNVTIGALKNMGCIESNGKSHYRPTDALRLALPDLD